MTERHAVNVCLFVAVAYALMKLYFTVMWWFDGFDFWIHAGFRPLVSDDVGALLGTKWIGTRNLGLGALLLGLVFGKKLRFIGMLLIMGVIVEFFDGFWLAHARLQGWVAGNGTFYMIGAFVWVPVLILCGRYLLKKADR